MRKSWRACRATLIASAMLTLSSCIHVTSYENRAARNCGVWEAYIESAIKPKIWTYQISGWRRLSGVTADHVFPEKSEPVVRPPLPDEPYLRHLQSKYYRALWHAREFSRGDVVKLWTSDVRIASTGYRVIDEQIVRVSAMLSTILQRADLEISVSDESSANVFLKAFRRVGEDYVLGHMAEIACLDSGRCTHRSPSSPEGRFPTEKYDWPFSDGDASSGEANYFHQSLVFIRDATVFTVQHGPEVNGYVLTDRENRIKKAVCYLDRGLSSEAQKEMVSECLVRSLGIFKFVTAKDEETVLGQRRSAASLGKVVLPTGFDLSLLNLAYDGQVSRGDPRAKLVRKSMIEGCGPPTSRDIEK